MSGEKMKGKSLSFTLLFLIMLLIFSAVCVMFCYLGLRCVAKAVKTQQASVGPEFKKCIIIDAGHGGEDGGTVGKNGVTEKELNLEIAVLLRDMLESCGYKVIMTRTEDILLYDRKTDYKGHKKQQDLSTRLDIAKSNPDAVFVSIHMNAFAESKYSGLQVYYSPNDPGSAKLAEMIQNDVEAHLQSYNQRKIKAAGKNIYLLDRMDNVSVLVECGFLSNDAECDRLSDDEYQKKLAFLMFRSIDRYICGVGS